MKLNLTKYSFILGFVGLTVLTFFLLFSPLAEAKPTARELEDRLSELQESISQKEGVAGELQGKIDIYEENIKTKQQEKATLNSQLEVLDQDIAQTKTEIEQTQVEIESLGLEIESLEIKVSSTANDISDKKEQMSKLVRELYNFDQQTYLEIALSNATLSDFSTQVEYTTIINNEFKASVDTLQELKQQLQEQKRDRRNAQKAEQDKEVELETRQQSLEGETDYKEGLLANVQTDEAKFQQLVEDVRTEQSQYNAEISRLEKSARATLDKINQNKGNKEAGDTSSAETDPLPSDFDPIWPVTGTITTLFRDPSYIFRSYFEHDAIDIAAPQGTALKAADSGVVALVKYDGTSNYAYVMIVHANNFATIYGHVSEVYVEPDEVVQKGQIIAAVGGLPGTAGAGRFTTGPHVHFGVRLNGIPVDPLLYLP